MSGRPTSLGGSTPFRSPRICSSPSRRVHQASRLWPLRREQEGHFLTCLRNAQASFYYQGWRWKSQEELIYIIAYDILFGQIFLNPMFL
ncbi:hypothetical protein SLE2022_148090 [Rubroshorea leprosula]